MKKILLTGLALFAMLSASAQKEPVDYESFYRYH